MVIATCRLSWSRGSRPGGAVGVAVLAAMTLSAGFAGAFRTAAGKALRAPRGLPTSHLLMQLLTITYGDFTDKSGFQPGADQASLKDRQVLAYGGYG